MKRIGLLTMTLAAALTVACGGGGRSDSATANDQRESGVTAANNQDNELGSGDRDFVEDQLEAGMAEIELGKLATQKGASAEVKQFGQMMIDEHRSEEHTSELQSH